MSPFPSLPVGKKRSSRPPGRYWGGLNRKNDVAHTTGSDRGRDVHITYAGRTIDKLAVSKLHLCKIGNWVYSRESMNSAVVDLRRRKYLVDTRLGTSFGVSERSFMGEIVTALLPTVSPRSTESDKTFVRDHRLL